VSRRTAIAWAVVFIALALVGGADRVGDLGGGDSSSGGAGAVQADALVLGRVVRVVDGDTVKVRLESPDRTETVRYIGVDTPESVKPDTPVQCFAKPASAFNRRLVEGRRVRLRIGRERRDRYGRLLAYVFVTGERPVFVNAALVRGGYARTLAIPPNTDRAGLFARLEDRAQRAGRGLWGACP
jgi:micrococcal nuclease